MDSTPIDQEIARNYRHNFVFNLLDIAIFMLGVNFYSASIILPLYVSHFTKNPLVIGLIPTLGFAGFLLPQIFTSNWVERLPRKIYVPVVPGFFIERLPVFLLAPSVMLFAGSNPTLALAAVIGLYGLTSIGGGIGAVAWADMIAKVIPIHRRGFFFGFTGAIGTGTGVIGASLAAWLLGKYAFPQGYIWSFGVGGVFIFLSWVCLSQVREPFQPNPSKPISQMDYFRSLPSILRRDHNFSRYLVSQIILSLGGMAAGFIVVYAVQRWQLTDEYAGTYNVALLVGQAIASLLFGPLADRRGYKLVMEIGILFAILSIGVAILAPDPYWFFVVYALRGVSIAAGMMASVMIVMEFCTPEIRPTYIGLANTVPGIAAVVGPLLGGYLADLTGYRWVFVVAFVLTGIGYAILHWMVSDPRRVGKLSSAIETIQES